MPTRLRNDRVEFPDNSEQTTARSTPIFAGVTNYSNVRSSYSDFPVGTTVGFWRQVGRQRGFTDRYKVLYKKVGSDDWTEVGGG